MKKLQMNGKLIFRIYSIFYTFSAIAMLIAGWFDGGSRTFFALFLYLIFFSIFAGPHYFYRILHRLPVWIPRSGQFGQDSKNWEWWFYLSIFGIIPIFTFSAIAIGYFFEWQG